MIEVMDPACKIRFKSMVFLFHFLKTVIKK